MSSFIKFTYLKSLIFYPNHLLKSASRFSETLNPLVVSLLPITLIHLIPTAKSTEGFLYLYSSVKVHLPYPPNLNTL